MSVLDITRFEQIEEIITTIHKVFPHLPKVARRILTELVPYISFGLAVVMLVAVIASFFFSSRIPQLLPPNLLLLRAVGILLTYILFISFNPLAQWMKRGWYNLFYSSLIQFLVTLIFFNLYSLFAQVLIWYVLFEIKKEYT